MYAPPHFRLEDQVTMASLIGAHPFGLLADAMRAASDFTKGNPP